MGDLPFSQPFDVRKLGSGRLVERLIADEPTRRAIAQAYDLLGLDKLEAELVIESWSRSGVKIDGRIRAKAVQACVVTLEPVAETIDHSFSLTFAPPEALAENPKTVAEAEVIVHFDEDDPPDPLIGNTIDLGAVVVEQFVLALDPYPRAPGAALPSEVASEDVASDSPFAALSKLRDEG